MKNRDPSLAAARNTDVESRASGSNESKAEATSTAQADTRLEARDLLSGVPEDILADLRRRHSEPQRAYHDWRHVEELLALFGEIRVALRKPKAVLFATLFHDAVYDPPRGDNEKRSADLLRTTGGDPLAPEEMATAVALIDATKNHRLDAVPDEDREDARLFLDMDLAILGAPPDRFDEYQHQIRAEYRHVPDDVFREGRKHVLRRFLERQPLFLSRWGQEKFGALAAMNLRRALAYPKAAGQPLRAVADAGFAAPPVPG